MLDNPASTGDFATLSGVLSNGGVSKAGNGTLYITNTGNTFTGGLVVTAGILRLNSGRQQPAVGQRRDRQRRHV